MMIGVLSYLIFRALVSIDFGMYILQAQRSVSGKGSALGHHQFTTALSSCSMYLKQDFLMGFVSRIISDGGAAAAPSPFKALCFYLYLEDKPAISV